MDRAGDRDRDGALLRRVLPEWRLGPGPGEDPPDRKPLNAQQKAELKRINDASRKAVRDAEERLRHLNPMGGG